MHPQTGQLIDNEMSKAYAKAILHNPGLAEEAVYAEHCHAEPVHIGLAPHVMLVSCIVKRRIAEDKHNYRPLPAALLLTKYIDKNGTISILKKLIRQRIAT